MTRRRIVAGIALALLLALAALTAQYILWPGQDEPARADAVVVLAGGGGERLREGARLVDGGIAPVLVLSHGECGRRSAADVICFTPEPDRTQGEARAVAELAREHRWRRVVVVTSRYHVSRTRLLFRRCLDVEVRAVGARPETWRGLPTARQLVREWLAWGHALTVGRGC